ncbi:MAG: polysaccharide biosynthesis C-terminal domain-containing protein [Candidatus Pedobacter colombiensis]|uniref:Polysaccharide biosynthesis C-terminal domain-containing protein n=1 Tax=Candidatus Pedobacter colombiensis TaxID=3121371 RepID=A0AAJ5W9F7_9SPHI|nr:polysaccharide biosynthesis C-terminal domain-containing protein [Pedobacter sp.]WEK19601.1 MAG: polysaccharide biosynthesis C-terminal domain-containing protein [Pedobacter sp.]
MGIIQQQTLKGTFYSYLGILLGFFSSYLIQPHVLTPEQIGLISILTSFSILFAQVAVLGFNATARIFPYFRDSKNHNNGYLGLACLISITGFIVFCIAAYFLKDQIIQQKGSENNLFETYYWYLIPLTFFTMLFNILELYSRMLYDTIAGRVLKEFTQRIFLLAALLLLLFKSVDFETFMWIWLLCNIIPTGMIAFRLYKRNQLSFRLNFQFLDPSIRRQIIHLCFFGILTGTSPYIIENIDKYMINEKFGLGDAGVYSLAFTFGTIISLPRRSLYSIAYTVIAEAWKNENIQEIKSVYKKSCITQLITTLFLFLLIWANIHNIYYTLPPEYASGRYVIFFIGLGYLIDSATGVNGVILATSKFYKYDSFFNVALIGVVIAANLIFIPRYGITGAAIASAITLFIFNLSRYLFILVLFKMQPFTYKTPLTIFTGIVIYFLVNTIPPLANFIVDGALRLTLITLLFGGTIYILKLSEDINGLIDDLTKKYLLNKK